MYLTRRTGHGASDPASRVGSRDPNGGLATAPWLIEHVQFDAPIPRSANPKHMAESLEVFDFTLSDDEMKRIHALKRPDGRIANPAGRAPAWDCGYPDTSPATQYTAGSFAQPIALAAASAEQ